MEIEQSAAHRTYLSRAHFPVMVHESLVAARSFLCVRFQNGNRNSRSHRFGFRLFCALPRLTSMLGLSRFRMSASPNIRLSNR